MATKTKIRLKLLVDENSQKVLFAEAGKDFVDFLFGLLEIPIGSITGLLMERGMADSGSLVKIYDSLKNLDPGYLQNSQIKETLLKPMPASSSITTTPSLLTNLLPRKQEFHGYGSSPAFSFGSSRSFLSEPSPSSSPFGSAPAGTRREEGYVKGMVTYMVMDDLEVKPMSSISSITLLNVFHIKDVTKLKEMTVEVDEAKALELMKALFESSKVTVLTDVFIRNMTPRKEYDGWD